MKDRATPAPFHSLGEAGVACPLIRPSATFSFKREGDPDPFSPGEGAAQRRLRGVYAQNETALGAYPTFL